jgi:uncharacterized membrane protein YkvA (DUF1232 family)
MQRKIVGVKENPMKNKPSLLSKFKREIKVYKGLLKDSRVPKLGKVLLGAAVAYALSPIDLIPDFIPVIGHLDDLIIVPLLVFLALKTIPKELIEEYRNKNS